MFAAVKWRNAFLLILAVSLGSLFLPWFTFDAEVMGYFRGTNEIAYLILPLLLIFTFLFLKQEQYSRLLRVLTECLLVVLPAVTAWEFVHWPVDAMITDDPSFSLGWATVQPGYWISLVTLAAVPAVFPFLCRAGKIPCRDENSLGNEDKK